MDSPPRFVPVLGACGPIGRAVTGGLPAAGHRVTWLGWLDAAAALLAGAGWPAVAAWPAVAGGAAVDLVLGLGALVRPRAWAAALGMVPVSLIYLARATLWLPRLWLDPIGPPVKVLPVLVLALVARVLLVNR